MSSPTVVIAQSDPTISMELANQLRAHFARVTVAENAVKLHAMLLRHEAWMAVLDLEVVNLEEIRNLASTFNDLAIVVTYRLPDERMWMAALNAGAIEFCHPQDIRSILRASRAAAKPLVAVAS